MTKLMETWNRNWKAVEEADKEAKAQGILVGRYYRERFADGYAIYKIVIERARTCVLEVVTNIGDDWILPRIGERGSMSKNIVVANINQRDALTRIFSEQH